MRVTQNDASRQLTLPARRRIRMTSLHKKSSRSVQTKQSPDFEAVAEVRRRVRDLAVGYLADRSLHDSAVRVLAALRDRGCR